MPGTLPFRAHDFLSTGDLGPFQDNVHKKVDTLPNSGLRSNEMNSSAFSSLGLDRQGLADDKQRPGLPFP